MVTEDWVTCNLSTNLGVGDCSHPDTSGALGKGHLQRGFDTEDIWDWENREKALDCCTVSMPCKALLQKLHDGELIEHVVQAVSPMGSCDAQSIIPKDLDETQEGRGDLIGPMGSPIVWATLDPIPSPKGTRLSTTSPPIIATPWGLVGWEIKEKASVLNPLQRSPRNVSLNHTWSHRMRTC